MVFEELNVDIGADVADFTAGVNRAEEEAVDLSLSLRRVGAAASSAERDIDSAGRSAFTSAAGFSALAASASGAAAAVASSEGAISAFRFASLSASAATFTFAGAVGGALVPALTALTSTLVPLTATLGGVATAAGAVAGAFGAVVGSGLLAFGRKRAKQNRKQLEQVRARIQKLETLKETQGSLTQAQAEELKKLEKQANKLEDATKATGALGLALERLKRQLTPIIADFGKQFVPLIEDAIAALPGLTRSIIQALGSLEPFRRALRDFGAVARRVIPQVVSRLAELARNALPAVRNAAQFLLNNGAQIFSGILRTTRQVAPLIQQLASSFASIIPEVNRLGIATLNTLLPAISSTADEFGGFIQSITRFIQSDAFAKRLKTIGAIFTELKPELRFVVGSIRELTDPATLKGIASLVDGFLDLFTVVSKIVDPLIEVVTLLSSTFGGIGAAKTGQAGVVDQQQTARLRQQGPQNFSQTGFAQATNQPQVNVNIDSGDGRIDDLISDIVNVEIGKREAATKRGTGGVQSP